MNNLDTPFGPRGQASRALASLHVQCRVIKALIAREILTRYGRNNIGFAWVFVEPMLFTLAITWLWSLTKIGTTPGLSVPAFAVTGYSAVLIWRNAASRCTKAVQTNWALLFHRNVTPLDIFLARSLIEVAAASISLMVMAAIFIAIGWMELPADPFRVVWAWCLLSVFAVVFGTLVGAASELSDTFERLWHVMAYLLFPISGAMFLVHWLPESAQSVVLWLPMVHGVEMLRGGWFGPVIKTYDSAPYLITSSLVLAVLALALVRLAGRRVEPQ